MDEETLESPLQGTETVEEDAGQNAEKNSCKGDTVEEDVGQRSEKKSSEIDETNEAAPESSDGVNAIGSPSSGPMKEKATEEAKSPGGEPPVDWFEPLEDDDDDAESNDRNDPEEESLAGESERSESVGGSESTIKKIYQ